MLGIETIPHGSSTMSLARARYSVLLGMASSGPNGERSRRRLDIETIACDSSAVTSNTQRFESALSNVPVELILHDAGVAAIVLRFGQVVHDQVSVRQEVVFGSRFYNDVLPSSC